MHQSVWDIKQALAHERQAIKALEQSSKHWNDITDDLKQGVNNITTTGNEWKIRKIPGMTRKRNNHRLQTNPRHREEETQSSRTATTQLKYESQHLYNRMLLKQIQRMRTECRMLRCGVELSTDAEIKELETVGDCRKLLRNLKVERWSLLSLRTMYERQLDVESMGYYRARDALEQLTKDVKNHQDTWIREQEKIDSEVLSGIGTTRSPRKLKPLVNPPSDKPVARIEPLKVSKRMREESYLDKHNHHNSHTRNTT